MARPAAALYYCDFAQLFFAPVARQEFLVIFFRAYSAAVYTIVICALFLFVRRHVMALYYRVFGSNFFRACGAGKIFLTGG